MLADENDGGGEENGNETLQKNNNKKIPRVDFKVQKHGGVLNREKCSDFCNSSCPMLVSFNLQQPVTLIP